MFKYPVIAFGLMIGLVGVATAVKITNLSIPATYILDRNNPEPLKLDCEYEMAEKEEGFVLKWFHDSSQIYQWIPSLNRHPERLPVAMQSFKNRVSLDYEASKDSLQKYRALVITQPLSNFTGEYSCHVQTYQSSDKKSGKLQIIVPPSDFQLNYMISEDGQVTFKCAAQDTAPAPVLTIFINGENMTDNDFSSEKDATTGLYDAHVTFKMAKEQLEEPTPVSCELTIPRIDYKQKREINYNEPITTTTTETEVAEIAIANPHLEDKTQNLDAGNASKKLTPLSLFSTIIFGIISAFFIHL